MRPSVRVAGCSSCSDRQCLGGVYNQSSVGELGEPALREMRVV